jgi:hypothetical protein
MNRLPPSIILYGIEGESFGEGGVLSRVVDESASRVIELVLKQVQAVVPGSPLPSARETRMYRERNIHILFAWYVEWTVTWAPSNEPHGLEADHVADLRPGEERDQMCKMRNRH